MGVSDDSWVDVFEEQRARLFGLAYRMLGSAVEAEDVLQDSFLRWQHANRADVVKPSAFLAKMVTNLCLTVLSSARRQRENYVGPWLPEPVLTNDGDLGPLETVQQRESVSLGVLALLERLTPPERAVFVLREAFGHSHQETAGILDIAEAHSRQLHRRARQHVGEAEPRFVADDNAHRELVERFLSAITGNDKAGLDRLLAEDAVSWADGGGQRAARRPISGRDQVVRYLLGLGTLPEAAAMRTTVSQVNGAPAVIAWSEGQLRAVMVPEIRYGRVTSVYVVVNTTKLTFVASQSRNAMVT